MTYAASSTLITTGMLPVVVLASAALTAPVSLFLLWRYRCAVLGAMAKVAGCGAIAPAAAASVAAESGPSLRIQALDPSSLDATESLAYRQSGRSLCVAASVYVAAGIAYACVMAGAWMVFTREDGFAPTRFIWMLFCYAWPTALAVCIVAAASRAQRVAVLSAYFALLVAVAIYSLARNAELTAGQVVNFWLLTNAPATLLLLAFLHRRVRAVGPLVLVFMVTALTGSQVVLSLVGASDSAMRVAVDVGSAFGLGGRETFFALIVCGFIAFGFGGWWLLKWIGRRYQQRRMSDQSLTLDAMWLLFGIEQSITFAFQGWAWIFTGFVAFLVYKLAAHLGFRIVGIARPQDDYPTLLLLRVFALGRRSERLFDSLSKRWLRVGSVTMIAGPDLVASTVEPHEFLQFMGGELSRQFVSDRANLEQRVEAIARGPDPDGRYRVHEFFCHADTWQMTMQRLATDADGVVMDLRSFSPSNQGCIFEIGQLLDSVDLRHVVLIVDQSTDKDFLERSLREVWPRIRADSPNRACSDPQVRVLHLAGVGARDVRALLKVLLAEQGKHA